MLTAQYWDYTLDMAFYNETTWRSSSIWDDEVFGMVPKSETDSEVRTSGVWAYQKIPVATDSETTQNAFGLLRAPCKLLTPLGTLAPLGTSSRTLRIHLSTCPRPRT